MYLHVPPSLSPTESENLSDPLKNSNVKRTIDLNNPPHTNLSPPAFGYAPTHPCLA
ncbi:hypothetical protein IE53DRAFT_385150 [Violaceomyces palustris]|uniref:Uncharacterized protein n=1 Tax=Violaceomyces palustris TaxID=1673888 RepID=A0ACD0P2W7_9BASI|nr:hypothetical protein IE53DRAFT_385150 [Violaceomyces palustris]